MPKNRLFSLLIVLSLTVFALIAAPPAAQADLDCSQFNTYRCSYHLNTWGCCVANGIPCPGYCPIPE
jgi:hypothetical protein